MGRLIRLLENRTALLLAGGVLLLAAVFFGAGYAAVACGDRQAAVSASDRMLAAAGRLAENTSLSGGEIAAAFTAEGTEEAKRGEEILGAYGYTAGSGRGSELLCTRSLLPAFLAAGGVLLCGVLGLIAAGRILRNARELTRSAEDSKRFKGSLSDRDLILLSEAVNGIISQRESALGKLSGEKRYLAEYLQDFSHQIRTPSAGLTLNNEICRTHPMPREELMEYLERDRICIERINRLCAESLKLARLEAGAVEYRFETAELSRLAEKACVPLYELAAANGTELSSEVPDGLTLECDPLWLGEAVSNLIKNACEHTRGGLVTVSAVSDPMSVSIIITDNGEGIADSEIPNLFKRFWSRHHDSDSPSVGIGMSVAKRITEDMGGKIYVDTEVGVGTEVRLEFLRKK
ncbi:Signal transduction histidine kinase [Ruminococcaceae bacterium FB2012]|nr:Signal transduction histidine kinase [Ruminococcaceae bacterium FB2012]